MIAKMPIGNSSDLRSTEFPIYKMDDEEEVGDEEDEDDDFDEDWEDDEEE